MKHNIVNTGSIPLKLIRRRITEAIVRYRTDAIVRGIHASSLSGFPHECAKVAFGAWQTPGKPIVTKENSCVLSRPCAKTAFGPSDCASGRRLLRCEA